MQFDPTFLPGNSIDVSRFERGNIVLPGIYTVELYVNDQPLARRDVRFVPQQGSAGAQPCLTRALLQASGVDMRRLESSLSDQQEGQDEKIGAEECVDLSNRIPDAAVHYDAGEQQLTLSIPQAALRHTARGEVDPSLWSDGVPAGLLRYDANIYRTQGNDLDNDSGYLGLMAGLNLGGWRFRQRSALNYNKYSQTQYGYDDHDRAGKKDHTSFEYQSIETYAQHDVTAWKSTFTVGDSTTNGELFDSFSLRGVQLASDDRMYPNSLRGYAPVLHGVARSNAKVEVRQNGNVIYQTTVAPGAFTIDDLNPTGYGGDLEVTVTEADGSRHTFSAPYASVPQLLRPGRSRYSVAFGQYRSRYQDGPEPYVGQLLYQRGLSDLFTGYTGALGADNYAAVLVGSALNTYWGAFALDLTAARAQLPEHVNRMGQSWRLSYAKILPQTDTSLTLAAYRYSTSGYYSFTDAMQARQATHSDWDDEWYDNDYRARDRLQLNISQRVGANSSLYAMGMVTSYWTDRSRDMQFQVGYSTDFSWGQLGVSVQRTRNAYGAQDNQVYASLSIPFGRQVAQSPLFSSLTTSVMHDTRGDTTLQSSASGTAGANNAWSYGLNGNYTDQSADRTTSLGGNVAYTGGQGAVSASASQGEGVSQYSLNGSGSLILHAGGLTFGQAMSPDASVALIEADGAAGAIVTNAAGVVVDGRGYAVVPYLTPYQVNTLELDPQGLSDDVELKSTSQDVVPRAGTVVRATFETQLGAPLILHVRKGDGQVVPMGADVFDSQGRQVGVVGQGGMLFARGVPDRGTLTVRWGSDAGAECALPYQRAQGNAGIALACTPGADRRQADSLKGGTHAQSGNAQTAALPVHY
ncbi:fimbria/pilus outer membrane usher protein [Bordetella genomosp. 8]|uniref:fimbria/pilus outer membrane usher protein n=1 Tax=Bordetella genomosp. 8 TaxID=1416806 RepID=UPI0018DF35FC|nr:fimbria/pilus outer membrane usher protein [Bordetella genomosp. 8]